MPFFECINRMSIETYEPSLARSVFFHWVECMWFSWHMHSSKSQYRLILIYCIWLTPAVKKKMLCGVSKHKLKCIGWRVGVFAPRPEQKGSVTNRERRQARAKKIWGKIARIGQNVHQNWPKLWIRMSKFLQNWHKYEFVCPNSYVYFSKIAKTLSPNSYVFFSKPPKFVCQIRMCTPLPYSL